MVKDTDLAWLAGIIDGEGSIMFFDKRKSKEITRGWIATAISVTNCDERMIKRISEIFFELGLKFHFVLQKNDRKNKKWHVALKIEVTGLNTCKKLLNAILPYLVNKDYLAKFLLKYIEWRQEKGFNHNRSPMTEEEIQRWFNLYEIVKKPKFISPETTRRASIPLGMDDDIVRALRRRKELNPGDSE